MEELDCMKALDTALQSVTEAAIRERIVSWLAAKYGVQVTGAGGVVQLSDSQAPAPRVGGGQIAGIAKLSEAGEVQLTIRDLKAKSANDAALRLVHVLIWATHKLTSAASTSSKSSIVPWLRKYRCYDGNTRGAIAQDKGIVRDGDSLSLDFHAEQLAEKFVAEILDANVEGKWKPGSPRKKSLKAVRTPEESKP